MAWAYVVADNNLSISATGATTLAFNVNPTNGNALVVGVGLNTSNGAESIAVTDNATGGSNTYTKIDSLFNAFSSGAFLWTFVCLVVAGSPTSLTVTITGGVASPNGRAHTLEFSGGAGSVSGHAIQHQAAVTGTNALTSGTTVGGASDLSVAFTVTDSGTACTAGTGYALAGHASVGLLEQEHNAPTAGSGAGTFSNTTTLDAITAVVALAFAAASSRWGFDEDRSSPETRYLPFRRKFNDPDVIPPFVHPPWGPFAFDDQDNPLARGTRHMVFRRRHNDPDLVAPFIHAPWKPYVFDDQDNPRHQRSLPIKARQGDPDLAQPSRQWVGFVYDEPPVPRRLLSRAKTTDPDITVGTKQFVFLDEPVQIARRQIGRARPPQDPDIILQTQPLKIVEEALQRARQLAYRPHTADLDAPVLPTAVVATTVVFVDDLGPVPRRLVWHHPLLDPDLIRPLAPPWRPFVFDDQDNARPPRFARLLLRSRQGDPDPILTPITIIQKSVVDDAQYPRHVIFWRHRVDDLDFLFPFVPPPPPAPTPVIVLPNGRWRSVIKLGESFDDNYLSPIVGEIGFTLFYDTDLATSPLLSAMTLTFVKPSGAILSVGPTGFFGGIDPVAGTVSVKRGSGGTGFVRYIFGPGDLDEAGRWAVFLTIGSSRASGIAYFRVLSQIEALLN